MGNYIRFLHDTRSPEVIRSEEIAEAWAEHEESKRKLRLFNTPPESLVAFEIDCDNARKVSLEDLNWMIIKGELDEPDPFRMAAQYAEEICGIDFDEPRFVLDFYGEIFHNTRFVHFFHRELRDFITANQGDI